MARIEQPFIRLPTCADSSEDLPVLPLDSSRNVAVTEDTHDESLERSPTAAGFKDY